jgi:uncharacterized protein
MKDELQEKHDRLKSNLLNMKRVLVAFSGGVDSTFLLKTAHDILEDGVLAVTAVSEIHPEWETEEALNFARKNSIRYKIVKGDEMDNPDFTRNPPERCYICKQGLFCQLKDIAEDENISFVLDGENAGDVDDFRPGSRAAGELGVRSPLKEVGLNKDEIRRLSRLLGLSTWNKPSQACLASRFPYYTEITARTLKQVEDAEEVLHSMGISQVRVRHHNDIARIEVLAEDLQSLFKAGITHKIIKRFKKLGYTYITLDLAGYRTGSLNEMLISENKGIE